MGKSTFILTEDLHIQDPHDVFLSLFKSSNDEGILIGTAADFLKRTVFLVIGIVAMRTLFENYLPGVVDIITAIVVAVVSVYFVTYFIKIIIPLMMSIRAVTILAALLALMMLGVVLVW